jgi:uncharacterized repeat protein (TIGR01451 family)
VTNSATLSGGGDPTCPAAARCTSTAGPTTVNAPQLTMAKTASASPWTVGVPASYTLQLSNTGTAATTAVATISDTIPTGLTIGTLPAGCTAAGQTVTCAVPAGLAAGGSTSFVIPVTPTLAAGTSVTNSATVSGGGDLTCPGDARCTSTAGPTPVDASADLSITKTQSTPNPAVPGQVVTWTVTVTNNGPSEAAAVTTIDAVTASVTGLSVGGTDGAACSVTGQNVDCDFVTVANGATRTYTITGMLAANVIGNLSNTATVTSTTADSTPGNNSSTSNTPSAPSADAAIAKTLLTGSPVAAGGTLSYQIVVTNAGPSNLVGASVADTIPAQLTGVTWTCTATGSASCGTANGAGNVATTVDIAAGGGNSIMIVVTGIAPVTTPSTIAANTATVTPPGGTTDPNPGNDSSTVPAIPVTALAIVANPDAGTVANGASGGVGVPDVLVNDTLDGAPATLSTVTLAQLATTNPNVTLNPATGEVRVAPGTPAGTRVVTYEICEILNLTNCDTATATIAVGGAAIVANPDTGAVANGANGGVAVPNVLVNDTLDGVPATLATVGLTQTATTNPNVTLKPATGEVAVAPNTPAGTYTVTYQICQQLNPTDCSTTTVTVMVGAAPIDAVDDDYLGTPVNGVSGGSLPSVLVNDTLNGGAATVGAAGNVTLTPGAAPMPAAGSTTINDNGTITIAPGTTAGVYTYPYTICETLNGTSNCDSATATAIVVVGVPVIDAVNDDFTATSINGGSGGTTAGNVLTNDTLYGAPVTLSTVTLSQLATSHPNVTLNAAGTIAAAAGTPAGTYMVTYQICALVNDTNNCDTADALVSIVVPPAAPTGITAVISGIGVVTVSWQAPVDNGGAPIQSYTVTAQPVGLSGNASTKNSTSCTVTGSPPPTSCQISGLMPGVTYTFNVAASNGTGSTWGTGVSLMIPSVPAEVIPSNDTWALLLVMLGVMAMAWHGFAGRRCSARPITLPDRQA